jgi:hypothetical protein
MTSINYITNNISVMSLAQLPIGSIEHALITMLTRLDYTISTFLSGDLINEATEALSTFSSYIDQLYEETPSVAVMINEQCTMLITEYINDNETAIAHHINWLNN